MKARLLYIFLLISFTASAQVDTVLSQFNATINLYASSGSGPTFTIQGIINNTTGQYTASDVAIGDIIFASESDRCVRLRVDNVTVVGQAISATVTDLEGVVTNVPLGIAMIARETANNSFPLFVDGVSADLLACVRTHFTLLVDNIEGEQGPPGADTDSIYYTLNDTTYLATKGDTIPLPTLLDTAYAIADTLYFIYGTDTTEVLITDTDTDEQNLSLVGDSLLIERGTGVDLSIYRDTFTDTNTDTDSIYFDNRSTIQLITRGDTIALPPDLVYDGDSSITNELQNIDSVVLSGNLLTVYISNGASASVDLSGYSPTDRADTSGYNLTFYISNDSLNLTDGIGTLKVDLSPYLDNTDTDSILVDSLGTLLVKNRGDVITLIPDTDTDTDKQNLSLVGDSLLIERGTGVDLSGYLDNTDTDTIIVDSAGLKTYTVTRNGTIYIPAGDGTGTDTSGYNQSFTKVGDSLILVDGTTRFAVYDADSVGGFPLPTDSITFNNNESGPDEAELNWDSTLGYLVFGGLGDQLIQIGQDQYWMTINKSNELIEKGDVVMAVGAEGNSGKFEIAKFIADGSIDVNYLLGVAAQDIPHGTEGYVMHQGKIRQIDLTAYNTGQILYVSPTVAGDWVTTEPSNGYQKLPIAFVVDSSANGTLAVRVKTGEALRDLHDVDVSSPADGSLIAFDSVLGYWVTKADSVIDDDADSLNEIQVISKSNDTVYLSKNGGFILDANIDSFYINYYGVTTRVAQGDTFYISNEGVYPDGYVHCGSPTVVNPVTSTTGAVWMDRNLGASQVAISSTDANSYGDLYQWGRFADGHQCRDSDTTSTNATTAEPFTGGAWDSLFIIGSSNWLTLQNDNLWQGVNGINNPCPSGYRLPTESELNAEILTWSFNNSAGAYNSPLKLPASGLRYELSGALLQVGSRGSYWSSSVSGVYARGMSFFSSSANLESPNRARGSAVRCIKNDKTIGQNGIYDNRNDSLNATVKEIGITEQLSFDNATLLIDGSNNRVGIGTASPSEVLDVVGDVEIDGKLDLNDGGESVFIGTNAGANDDGNTRRNSALGYDALSNNISGIQNLAIGWGSMRTNTTGLQNTAISAQSLRDNTSGNYNIAIGAQALQSNLTTSSNIGIGVQSLIFSKGNNTVAIGYRAGRWFGTGASSATDIENSILIGADARPKADFETNQIVIGHLGRGEGSNTIKIGNSSHNATYITGIKGQTTTHGANVHITADGRLMESTAGATVFDTLYSSNDTLYFITPTPDTFYVTFTTVTDEWGNQVVQSDATLGGTGVTGDLLTLAQQSATDGQVLKWDNIAGTWLPANDIDTDTNTDEQDIDGLTFDTGTGDLTVGITNGTSQTIDLDGRYLEAEVDGSTTNEIQVLSKSNDTIYLSNGGGFVLDTDTDTYLTSDSVKIYASEMVTGNTETLINVTYDAVTQTFDFVVDNDLSNYDNSTSNFLTSEVDGSTTNELQNLSLVGDSIKITNGTGIDISAYLDNTDTDSILVDSLGTILVKNRGDVITLIPDTDEQNLSIVSDSLLIDRGSGVDLSVYLDNTDTSGYNSALSLVNDTLYLTDGNGTLGVYVPGDDWGDDVVQTDVTLTGNGTAGSPLSVVFPADEVFDGDSSITNELQELTWSAGSNGNDEITLSNGGNTITITDNTGTDDQQIDKFELTGTDLTLSIEDDGQADQTVSFAGWDTNASDDFSGSWNDLTDIPAGFADNIDNVNDADSSATNELQTLSWSAGTNGNDEITLSVNNSSITITDNVFDGDSSATNEIQQLGWTQDTGLLTLTNSSNVTIDVYDGITRGLVPDSIDVVRPDDYYLNMDGTWKVPVDNDNYVDGFIMTDDNDDDVWQITLGRSPLSDIQETVDLSKYLDNTDTQDLAWTQSTGVLSLQNSPSVTIDTFNGTTRGLVPDSDSSTTKYLRADGTWVTPPDNNTQLSNEQVQDIVGGMVTGNTEEGITVTYQDGDGTIDFQVADVSATNEIQSLSLNVFENTNIVEWDLLASPNAVDIQLKGEGIIDFQTSSAAGLGEAIISAIEVDGDSTNELQTIDTFSLDGTTLNLSLNQDGEAAKTVNFTGWDTNAADDFDGNYTLLDFTGTTGLSDGVDDVNDADADSTNEIQTLSIDSVGRVFTISLTNGDSVKFEDKFEPDTDTDSIYFRHFNSVQNITRGDTAVVTYVVSEYPDGYVHCDTNDITKIKSVTSTTGRVWMDRNLGASRVAIDSADSEAYGSLFQWGRFAEGHQCRDSDTTSTNATTATPSLGNTWDGKFILETSSPDDWLTPQDDNLWQGLNGVNNPCPTGYRIPTESEWDAEINEFTTNGMNGAYASPLKLPAAGLRGGGVVFEGSWGFYWSSTILGTSAKTLSFNNSNEGTGSDDRALGTSLRCIKDQNPTQYILDESNSNKLITISEDNEFEYVDKRRQLFTNYTVSEGDTVTVDLRNQPQGIHNVTPTGVFTTGYTLNIANVFTDNTNYASEYTISLFDAGNAVTVNLDSNYTWISQLGNAITSFDIFEDNGFRLELYTIDGNTLYTNINQ